MSNNFLFISFLAAKKFLHYLEDLKNEFIASQLITFISRNLI